MRKIISQFYIVILNIMNFEWPNNLVETQEEIDSPEQQIKNRAEELYREILKISDINNVIQFKENSDGSETTLSIENSTRWWIIEFTLENWNDEAEREHETFNITVDNNWILSVNWTQVSTEKAQVFLKKIENNILFYKNYELKLKKEKQHTKELEEDQKASKLIDSLNL
jgi:hypothetical protein